MASAESVLDVATLADLPSASVAVAFDEASQQWLIVEERSWSVGRINLLSAKGERGESNYLLVPRRASVNPVQQGEVIDFREGKVWFLLDDKIYAFPLSELERESELSFSMG